MSNRKTCEASSNCDQPGHHRQEEQFTFDGINFKVWRRPEGEEYEDYTSGEMMGFEDTLEPTDGYCPGGYYPVHLGDTLGTQ